jgi:hydrogenase expression/formation protein HypD
MAVDLALTRSVVVATFGDMFRVPARMSLSEAKAQGGDIRVVFSVMDAVDLARREPDREVVFFAVGFETTAVTTAAAATGDVPANFSLLVSHRTIPTALSALLATPDIGVAGFLLPGHVITVMGTADYEELASRDRVPVAVGGFEPVDVLLGILELARMVAAGKPALVNCYRRAVRPEGNRKALAALAHAFEACDAHWRAIGSIPGSGLALRPELSRLDAQKRFGLVPDLALEEVRPGCSCGAVMLGKVEPSECPLFAKGCTPVRPYGPCMVSMEGTCRNAYKYRSV